MAPKTSLAAFFIVAAIAFAASPPAFACGSSCHTKKPSKGNINPPFTNPPVLGSPADSVGIVGGGIVPGVTPPGAKCTLDVLKLGVCVNVLGGLVHVGYGNPAENVCCPVLEGLVELEAAECLCTAIKLRLLNHDIYIPIALNLLINCGKTPPPGYLCPLT